MGKSYELAVTEEQSAALRALAKSNNRLEADRARAIVLSIEGRRRKDIAALLQVTEDEVSRWRGRFNRDGIDALRARPITGRPPKLAEAAMPVVRAILAEPPPPGIVWTVPRLAAEVQRRTGVRISSDWLTKVMRKKGGIPGAGRGTRSRAGKMWISSSDRD